MPLRDNDPFSDITLTVFVPLAGTPAGGVTAYIPAAVDGRLMRVGWQANSIVTSTLTMAVAIGSQTSSTASTYSQVITSTIGSFSSTNTYEGAVASVVPASPIFVTQGDSIQFTFSGGQSSTVGVTAHAVIRRA